MIRIPIYRTAVVIGLVVCLGCQAWLFCAMRIKASAYVTIEDYNKSVRAANQLTLSVSNLTISLKSTRRQTEEFTAQMQRLDGKVQDLQGLAPITNLYTKVAEIESKANQTQDAEEAERQQERFSLQLQGKATSRLSLKLNALEKAVIKLSLAVQESQNALAIKASGPIITTNGSVPTVAP